MKREPKLETKEDAINLVKDVFRSMGGRILPPNRPRHIDKYEILTLERDNFMMDFENACLSQNWDSSRREHPKGPNRHKDPEWAAMIQSQVYPHHSDVDWEEYVQWSSVHGDEWFLEPFCHGCDDPRDFDNIDWQTMPVDEFNGVLQRLGTCVLCKEELESVRKYEEEQSFITKYHEAQARLRTACLCRDMVRPLSTSLDERIVAMALIINGQRSTSTNLR